MSDSQEVISYLVKRHHQDVGEITFTVLSTDTESAVRLKVARGLQLANMVYLATPGMSAQPVKVSDKAKDSRVDPDIILGRLWFTCAWIPSAEDKKKPNVDAVKRVVGIVFKDVMPSPVYDRDTYRNWVPLTAENAALVLRNIALAPADIPATDTSNLVVWYFGGVPGEPPVKTKKTEASTTTTTSTPPEAAPSATPPQASAAPTPTPSTTTDNIDRPRLYKWAWDTFGLLDSQVERLIGNLAVPERTREHVRDLVTGYANATPISPDEVISWAQVAFKYVELPDVALALRPERLRTIANDMFVAHMGASRTTIYNAIQQHVDSMGESVVVE